MIVGLDTGFWTDSWVSARIRYGLFLGIAVGALGFLLPILGLHANSVMPTIFIVAATIVNVVMIFLALRATAASATWLGQLVNGLVVGVIGALLIFASSWVMTTVVFPDYYAEYAAGMRAGLTAAGMAADQVDAQMAAIEQTSPVSSAASGSLGAILTSLVAAAVIGMFKRQGR